MKYVVIEDFYDLQDGNRRYAAGDSYPRGGLKPPKQRIEALATDKNRLGRPLIVAEGANTEDANTEGANTEGANTEGANTEDTNTEGANTEGANTEGANAEGANTEGDSE